MPLREDLLNPIPGANPSGESLRYAPVYDKIKEARREDDDAPQGEWQRERKTADFAQVIKLAGEALATKTKDLQLAVWLTEALLKREGFSGLHSGLALIRGLIENFWDTLYPELEDGDAELRAAPLDWVGSRFDAALRSAPLTRKGLNWFQYKQSRAVGYEGDADTDQKLESRNAAIAEGKITGEEWDQAFAGTPKAHYASLEETLDGILETLEALSAICEEKFGDDTPSFGPMRSTVEEVRHTVHTLLQKKREAEPDAQVAEEQDEAEPEPEEIAVASAPAAAAAAPARAKIRRAAPTAEPASREDAFDRVIATAEWLRREDAYDPAPYLLVRGLRFGEVRAAGSDLDLNLLEPPPTETRQALKAAAVNYDWAQVLELAETAVALPCGRGWLDGHRYAFRAATELGYYQVASAVRAEVNAVLADYPGLREAALTDDTPAANPETQAWLDEIAPAAPPAPDVYAATAMEQESDEQPAGEDGSPDANDLALQAAQAGNHQEAIEILMREAAAESCGRSAFKRRLQLAQLCLSIGRERIAYPILQQLIDEIDRRGLEGWEAGATIAQPLALFYRCLEKVDAAPELKQKTYDRLCRLDPVQALSCSR